MKPFRARACGDRLRAVALIDGYQTAGADAARGKRADDEGGRAGGSREDEGRQRYSESPSQSAS